ncbi:hypothetical protein IEU95_12190 [Hoyosella rhizosphaerae]|uniref:Uncharacterized protein n=1 Tax=Hoyosella rhizosphaerae TaxID=1755582 RepID=A0A916U817_9ACTN|nr:hypothetical protein [Hoyosella rhizosphaerae]MBN4927594.1 hypothetical protein [Hoyosella rhizosphaerae]GGC63232.1 hypothetical protein GCM10011410_14580 [Hoyosella rhizosphaerae]
MLSIFDLSTVGEDQLGFPPSELYAMIFDGLLAAADFFGGIISLPGL